MIQPILKPKQIRKRREPVKVYRDGREVCQNTPRGKAEYWKRTIAMWDRQGWLCCICRYALNLIDATFEHTDLRGMGGGRRDDRISINGKPVNGAAHSWCNSQKGSKREA